MTQPVSHGYPDFTRQAPAADVVFFSDFNVQLNGQVTKGPYFCGMVPAIGFRTSVSLANMNVTVRFFNDAAGTVLIGSLGFDEYTTGVGSHTIPVLGPYFTVVLSPAATPMNYIMACAAVPHPYEKTVAGAGSNVILSQPSVAVGAGATVVVDASGVYPGEAHWICSSSLAAFNGSLYAVDYLGAETNLDVSTNLTNAYPRIIFSPYQMLRIKVTNQTGAAGTIGVRITAHPYRTV